MIVKTVKYKGFDGEDIEETIRLHLTKAEFLNLDLKYSDYGGLINYLRKLLTDVKDGDSYMRPMVTMLQTLILAAYGKKTDDGRFVKKVNGTLLADEFETSEAYSQLLIHLLSEEGLDEIEPLIMGIIPSDGVDPKELQAKKEQINAALNLA
ncbi:MAG: hypothetical protein IJ899_02880 [Blautia sp.]|nr:hypothetical protein [Blautia sp.]